MLYNHVWKGKSDTERKKTISMKCNKGPVLKITNIFSFEKKSMKVKVAWVYYLPHGKGLFTDEVEKLTNININGGQRLFTFQQVLNLFWHEVFKYWSKLCAKEKKIKSDKDICNFLTYLSLSGASPGTACPRTSLPAAVSLSCPFPHSWAWGELVLSCPGWRVCRRTRVCLPCLSACCRWPARRSRTGLLLWSAWPFLDLKHVNTSRVHQGWKRNLVKVLAFDFSIYIELRFGFAYIFTCKCCDCFNVRNQFHKIKWLNVNWSEWA